MDATTAFWADRSPITRVPRVGAAWGPDFLVNITYTEADHGTALPERPHLTVLRDAFTAAGIAVRYNVSRDTAACLTPGARKT